MKTFITAHRATLTRAIIALFVLTSIAAVNPINPLLNSIAEQIEQRAMVESNYANMAALQLRGESLSKDSVESLKAVQWLYSGRASALSEVAVYIRSIGAGGGDAPVVP